MAIDSLVNGKTKPRPIAPGVFAPLPTFFLQGSQDLDIPTFQKHVLKIARAGVGLVISGSMGEANHLTPDERITLIKAARQALDTSTPPLAHVPIIAGTGAGSTRQTIQLTRDAYEAGADYAIVIASGFFAGVLKDDRSALKDFWAEVARTSPLPLFIYNYPGASGGIDLESDLIEELAAEHSNIIGVKLTCGNVGKLTRIASTTSDPAWIEAYPRSINTPFLVLGGFTDFLVPSIFANAHGAITGLANLAPYSIKQLTDLAFASVPRSLSPVLSSSFSSNNSTSPTIHSSAGESTAHLLAESQRLQGIIAKADRTVALTSIAGTKFLLRRIDPDTYPSGAEAPRRPLRPTEDDKGEKLWAHRDVVALLEEEIRASLGKVPVVTGVITEGKLGVNIVVRDSFEQVDVSD